MTNSPVSLRDVYNSIESLRHEVQETYVTKGEFAPVRAIAYTVVSVGGIALLSAVIAQVINAYK